MPVSIVFVGGFLGAGKTTLLTEVANRLAARGKRVALIANDQAPGLVDTLRFRQTGHGAAEVAGGCFCCKFDDLIARATHLRECFSPEVILAEPVGSCTDIAATVLRPLANIYGNEFEARAFSVLLDVTTVPDGPVFTPDVRYVQQKQLEEADVIVLTKTDLVDSDRLAAAKGALAQTFPNTPIMSLAAATGEGVDAWLNYVMQTNSAAAAVPVDYKRYAAGEAELGWLNATVKFEGVGGKARWAQLVEELLTEFAASCRGNKSPVAHIKCFLAGNGGSIAGNLSSSGLHCSGALPATASEALLTVNARVESSPEALVSVFEHCLDRVAGRRFCWTVTSLDAFSPAEPKPTHRIVQ